MGESTRKEKSLFYQKYCLPSGKGMSTLKGKILLYLKFYLPSEKGMRTRKGKILFHQIAFAFLLKMCMCTLKGNTLLNQIVLSSF